MDLFCQAHSNQCLCIIVFDYSHFELVEASSVIVRKLTQCANFGHCGTGAVACPASKISRLQLG